MDVSECLVGYSYEAFFLKASYTYLCEAVCLRPSTPYRSGIGSSTCSFEPVELVSLERVVPWCGGDVVEQVGLVGLVLDVDYILDMGSRILLLEK